MFENRHLVLFTTFWANLIVDGYVFAMGLPTLDLEKQYSHVDAEWVAMIAGIYPSLYCLLAPLAMALLQCFGLKKLFIAGSLIQLLGFSLGFANHWLNLGFWFDLLSLGIIPGIGAALLSGPSVDILKFFPLWKERAITITNSGSPFGGILYGFLYKYIAKTDSPMGWRLIIIFYAAMAVILFIASILFVYKPPVEKSLKFKEMKHKERFVKALKDQFTSKIWHLENWVFYLFLVATATSVMGYPVPGFLITKQAEDPQYKVDLFLAENLVAIMHVANLIARCLTGIITASSHRSKWFTSYALHLYSFFTCSALAFIFPHVMWVGNLSFVTFIILHGFFCAPFIALRAVFLEDVFHENPTVVDAAFGWQLVSDATFSWVGYFISTKLNSMSSAYAYYFAGAAFLAAGLVILLTTKPYFRAYAKRKLNRERSSAGLLNGAADPANKPMTICIDDCKDDAL